MKKEKSSKRGKRKKDTHEGDEKGKEVFSVRRERLDCEIRTSFT